MLVQMLLRTIPQGTRKEVVLKLEVGLVIIT